MIREIGTKRSKRLWRILLNRCGGLKWLTGEPGMPLIIKEVAEELAKLKYSITDTFTQAVEANLQGLLQGNLHLWQPHTGLSRDER